MKITYNGRPVKIKIEMSGRSNDPVDAFVGEAWYTDTDEEITDSAILDKLTEQNPEAVYEEWFENQIDAADAAMDAAKDREWGL